MSEEIDTAELAPVVAAPQSPAAITFTIFETIVHGELIFHPGQEQALLDAALPPEVIIACLKTGALRGRYPHFESFEKEAGTVNVYTGK